MEIIKFKTNVEDQEALSKVAPYLNQVEEISKWNLDTGSADKVLSVSGTELNPQAIENAMKQAGYKAEILRVMGIGGRDL
ncbi:copper chaperone [uncultured Pontibacter sp.]|uniref:copper chaperone n=1 Tax=uncultured Pontibacter sp. TaxID=453356 RepID=UPI00262A05BB|nr:copper chaperone [uncultured Pontibacter sp.]